MARSIVLFVSFFAAALAGSAQHQPPFLTIAIPAAPVRGTQLQLPDLDHNAIQIVYPNSILTVRTDGTTSSFALPVTAASYSDDGSGHYGIVACIAPNGLMATVAGDPSAGRLSTTAITNVQIVDLASGTSKYLRLKFATYGDSNTCSFSRDGLLYIGADIPKDHSNDSIPGIIVVNPTTMQVVRTVMTGQEWSVRSLTDTANGMYVFSQDLSTVCFPHNNCAMSIGKIGSDDAFHVLYEAPMAFALTPMTAAPNGYLVADGKVFDQNGQPLTGIPAWISSASLAWPSNDPWSTYSLLNGKILPVNLYTFENGGTIAVDASYLSIAAVRQSDGTDIMVAMRSGFIDFFRVAPPQLLSYIANAGSTQPGPLAPGSIISVFGQALGSWNENDSADGLKITTKIGDTQVFVDGEMEFPIRLLYVGFGQVNAVLPSSLAVGVRHWLTVQTGSTAQVTQDIVITDQSLAAFMWAPDPANQTALTPILTDASYRLLGNAALSPAYAEPNPGDTVILWATGGGRTSPALDDSIVAVPTSSLFHLVILPQVLVDGNPALVTYAGLVPGNTPGLDQVNFVIPSGLAPGPHDFQVNDKVYRGGLWTK